MNGQPLDNGDAAMISDEPHIALQARDDSELVMMEVQVKVRV